MRVPRLVEALSYVAWLVLAVTVALLAPSAALGLPLLGLKVGLFFCGLATLGVSLLLLKPSKPGDAREGRSATWFEKVIEGLPPLRGYDIRPEERVRPGLKIALAGVTMLALSFLMEAVLGVRA